MKLKVMEMWERTWGEVVQGDAIVTSSDEQGKRKTDINPLGATAVSAKHIQTMQRNKEQIEP